MDASNMLKPALARGELHCVGATTLDEYRKHIEKDAALARRFQPVFVGQPDVDDTISILRGLKESYEVHHKVTITDGAIVAAATLSNRYITDRFLPDKAIDLIDEAAARKRMAIDSKPEAIDELDRRILQLRIEEGALKKEGDQASKDRLQRLRKELAELEQRSGELTAQWQAEKSKLASVTKLKEELERLRNELATAQRRGDFEQAGRIAYGELPQAQKALEEAEAQQAQSMVHEDVTDQDIAAGGLALDRHPGRPDDGGRARQAPAHGGQLAHPRRRPGGCAQGRGQRGAARARRAAGPEPADRLVPVPGADRRRQDRAVQGDRRLPVRRRPGHGPHRHVGVHGEALRGPADRRAPGLCRLRGGRCADRGGPPPALPGDPVRRGREGAPGRVQRPAAGAGRRAADRRPGPHGRLPQHHDRADLEPGLGVSGGPARRRAGHRRARAGDGRGPRRVPARSS